MNKTIVISMMAVLATLVGFSRAADVPVKRPNILFILADDLGWGDLSCYGNQKIRTPALDRLAREGTLFTQYYQGGSVCSPSRCSQLTGRWPAEFRIHGHYSSGEQNTQRDMSHFLDPTAATLPKLLKAVGYSTFHVGKWHLGLPPGAEKGSAALREYGFDETHWLDVRRELDGTVESLWEPANRPRASRELVDATIGVLDRVAGGQPKPFFCELWLNDPHAPLAPNAEQMKPYLNKNTPTGFTTPMSVYAATVAEMDRQIGRLLDKLDSLGLAKDTVVIFTSDNGPEDIEIGNAAWSGVGSSGPLRGRKRSLYEGGVRVPFLVRWPGGMPAGIINEKTVVSGADLLPTLCELAAAPVPADAQQRGQSVAAAFKGDKDFLRTAPLFWEWRFRVFNHRWNRSPILAIRDGQWKLLMNPDRSRVELYDIPADPSEQNNVAGQHPEVVSRLSEKVLAWQKTLPAGVIERAAGQNDYPWPPVNAAVTAQAKERGAMFEKKDKNGDGFMSLEEYLSGFPDPAEGRRRFPTFDRNSDGKLSRDEFIYMGR